MALVAGHVEGAGGVAASEEVVVIDGGVDDILVLGAAAKAVEEAVGAVAEADVVAGLAGQAVKINHGSA